MRYFKNQEDLKKEKEKKDNFHDGYGLDWLMVYH